VNYFVSPKVFELFPGYVRGVVVADGLSNGLEENPELVQLLRQAEAQVLRRADLSDVAAHPRIASWRAAYARFGARPSKFFSSIEALLRRVLKGGQLPYINDLAAIGTVFSLRHVIPVGGHDIGVVNGDLSLELAQGDESFLPIGSDAPELPEPGEVVYLAGKTVLCRRWTWRQAEFTKLGAETRYVAINVDGLPPIPREEVEAICEEMGEWVVRYCGGQYGCRYLSADNPLISLAL